MLLRLLGPMELLDDSGVQLDLGGPRQRLLLALLAARPGENIDVSELIDGVWGDDPPTSALPTVQSYVSRLRRIVGAPRLVSEQGTYRVNLPRSCVDLWVLVDSAAIAASLPDDRLVEICQLWRGPPFDDLCEEVSLRRVVDAANEAHMVLAADLGGRLLDRDAQVEAESLLSAAFRDHAHDERVASLLMRTQARARRPVDAVRTFRVLRAARREAGLGEPSAPTTRLRAAIAATSPQAAAAATLDRPVHASDRAVGLPTPSTSFVGRSDDLDALARLQRSHRWVTITGTPGVGKSRLAVESAWRWTRRTGAAAVFVGLSDEVSDPLARLAAALRVVDAPGTSRAATLGQALRARGSTLLLLDGAERLTTDGVQAITRLADVSGDIRILATSHAPVGAPAEHAYRLRPLPVPTAPASLMDSAAGRLLVDRVRSLAPGFTPHPAWDHHLMRIVHTLDGLPLAVELVASDVAARSPQAVAADVAHGQAPLAALEESVQSAVRPLGQRALAALARLSVTVGPVPGPVAVALVADGHPDDTGAQVAVDDLLRRHVLVRDERGVGMLDPIRSVVQRDLRQDGDWQSATLTHLAVLERLVMDAEDTRRTAQQGESAERVAALVDEIAAAARRHPDRSAALVASTVPWLYRAGEHRRVVDLVDHLDRCPTATAGPDRAVAAAYAALALAAGEIDWERAALLADEAVAMASGSTSSGCGRRVRLLRGDTRTVLGDYPGARRDLERVLDDDPTPCERALAELRLLRVRWSSPRDARGPAAERRRQIVAHAVDDCADPALAGYHLLTLGSREHHDGRLRRARRHYVRGMSVLRDLGHRTFEHVGAVTLADLDALQGRWDEAAAAAARLLAVGRGSAAGFPRHPQEILARAYAESGNDEAACDALDEVIDGARARGHATLLTAAGLQRAWLHLDDDPARALADVDDTPDSALPPGLVLDRASTRAACLVRLGMADEAIDLLDSTSGTAPDWPLLVERLRHALVGACAHVVVHKPVVASDLLQLVDQRAGESGYVLRRHERRLQDGVRRSLGAS